MGEGGRQKGRPQSEQSEHPLGLYLEGVNVRVSGDGQERYVHELLKI